MGIHTGEASVDAVGVVGISVHRAARILAAAHGGQVLVSEATASLLGDRLPDGLVLRGLGTHRLKDLGQPQNLYQLQIPGVDNEFPPIRSLDNPRLRHNLPVQVSSFVGRRNELREVARLVGGNRLLTLTGSGGCGKTRLALQVAADLLDGSADGVWFCDLAPLSDPDLVAPTVAGVLGLRGDSSLPILDRLTSALAGRRLLLVLDNCEHVIGAAAKLVDTILRGCIGIHVLATSREPLAIGGEQVYRVPSLSLTATTGGKDASPTAPDAVQLFYDRAREQRPDFVLDEGSLPTVVSICRHLDGIPLAIELATARLRSLSLGDIEHRLAGRFRLLTGGSRVALPRQQTLRATIDWSYDSLNQRDRAAFTRLSVFAGGFDLTAAEAVCACRTLEAYDVVEAVSSLVDKSLVQAEVVAGRTRYDLLETIRQYALERLSEDPEERAGAADAHARLFLELIETHRSRLVGPDQNEWLSRLEDDLGNLRTAGAHLLATGTTEEVFRFAAGCRELWVRLGLLREGIEYLEAALSRPDCEEQPVRAVVACSQAAYLWGELGDLAAERRLVERGLLFLPNCDDEPARADLLVELAWTYRHRGEVDRTLATIDEARAHAIRGGNERQIAAVFMHRGLLLQEIDPKEACENFEEAAERASRVGDGYLVATTLNNLSNVEIAYGDFEAARRHLEMALANSSRSTIRAFLLHNLGLLAVLEGDLSRAPGILREALELFRQMDDSRGIADCLLDVALYRAALGDPLGSAELHGIADVVRERVGGWSPLETRLRDESCVRSRAACGDPDFERAYAEGRMTKEDPAARCARELLEPVSEPSLRSGQAISDECRAGSGC